MSLFKVFKNAFPQGSRGYFETILSLLTPLNPQKETLFKNYRLINAKFSTN
ncbi:hypothetical protein [Helicobacter pylori]|uniref:hypothetical protein n=1 Tax=Helicobacter pylori TaxID=210 RepID=UPI00160E2BD9|nr:hypothetical protein [Helicobacter pylori]WQU60951.1 hypothetical protein KVE06_00060 [Helicobacter pylori]